MVGTAAYGKPRIGKRLRKQPYRDYREHTGHVASDEGPQEH